MVRWLVLALLLISRMAGADPDAVALLPLDSDQKLEIYGQPVASEIARELVAGGIDVVVVGPKMAVPERARLVIDGTIAPGKGDAVVLAVRIRERATGATLDKLDATAPALTNIDRAASDLAARVLPTVKARLAVVSHPAQDSHLEPRHPPVTAPAAGKTLAIEVVADPRRTTLVEHVLPDELATWAARHHWHADTSGKPGDARVVMTVLAFDVTPGAIPMGHARVRVRIGDSFDRVVVTDSVVGERNISMRDLAARTARAVLDIVDPHMRRKVPGW
jgi:hypothetical protein